MIYIGYVTRINSGGKQIAVSGNKARAEIIANLTGGELFEIHKDSIKPDEKSVVVIDDNHETNLRVPGYKIRLSDKIGIQLSDYDETICFNDLDVFTVKHSLNENAWQGHGGYVVFAPGGAETDFWERASVYHHYCEQQGIPFFIAKDLDHNRFMNLVRYAEIVVTASGVTLHEMVYQAVPTIAILTSDNQIGNYTRFVSSRMSAPQDIDPGVINNVDVILEMNKNCRNEKKKTMINIARYITEKHDEINR